MLASGSVSFGDSADLLPPRRDNPHGFWEDRKLVKANENILRSWGLTWFDPFTDLWDSFPPRLAKKRLVADHVLRLANVEAVKDPRLCLTGGSWSELLSDRAILHVVRSPQDVAMSLLVRNRIPLEYGMALWATYVFHALKLMRSSKVAVTVGFEDLVSTPKQSLKRLCKDVGVDLDLTICAGFVDDSLAQNHPNRGELSALLPDSLKELHEVAKSGTGTSLSKALIKSLVKDVATLSRPHRAFVNGLFQQATLLKRLQKIEQAIAKEPL